MKPSIGRMPRTSLRVLLVLVAGGGLVHCSASDDFGLTEGAGGAGDGIGVSNETDVDVEPDGDGGPGTGSELHPLCGVGICIPDDQSSCDFADGFGGAGGASLGGAGGGLGVNPGDLATRVPACRVQPDPDCSGSDCRILRSCEVGGAGEAGEPCVASEDCAPGLACIGDQASGVCRPYCCRGNEASCGDGTFCDERPLTDSPSTYVPVCVVADDCPLSEPYPCEGAECVCQGDEACVVVRRDGTTSCTTPGPGRAGDACTGREAAECAYGFICALEAGCMKVCSTTAEDSGCPEGAPCQYVSSLGDGLGVCIGLEDDGIEAAR